MAQLVTLANLLQDTFEKLVMSCNELVDDFFENMNH